MTVSQEIDRLAKEIVDCAYTVHKEIGPGLLENAYEILMVEEITSRGLSVKTQVPLIVKYKGTKVDMAYRLDLVIEDKILIELKSCEKLLPIHEAQILTYLKLSDYSLGFLMNFGSTLIKDGLRRFVV